MINQPMPDYTPLDRPEILMALFHPRPEWKDEETAADQLMIPVDQDVMIGARHYVFSKTAPTLLFFHGNGEIVADYEEMGPVYNQMGINFFPVDYRGYGRSTGNPSISAMMRDCHLILEFLKTLKQNEGFSGPLIVMGRSLGSASALELANAYPDQIHGLIIESGFAFAGPLLQLLGVQLESIGSTEISGFDNIKKIKGFHGPVLIIHAEHDHIIPFSDGQALHDASVSNDKNLLKIPGANHNDILARGFQAYTSATRDFVETIIGP